MPDLTTFDCIKQIEGRSLDLPSIFYLKKAKKMEEIINALLSNDTVPFSAKAGIVLAIALSYTPKLKTWFEGLDGESKRLVVGVLIVLIAVGSYWAGCQGIVLEVLEPVQCSQAGLQTMVDNVIWALLSSQATYQLLPKKKMTEIV